MNFTKVFRRQSNQKQHIEQPASMHPQHAYPRPFSYHIPTSEQVLPLKKPVNSIPYRIGLSSDRGLLTQANSQENDQIARLSNKSNRDSSPKRRKDRRHQSQLNSNKKWLFRSMEALDEWKDKVFSPKLRLHRSLFYLKSICLFSSSFRFSFQSSNQSRSRSVENLADEVNEVQPSTNNKTIRNDSSNKDEKVTAQYRSVETITNRVMNGIGRNKKHNSTLMIEKQLPPERPKSKRQMSPSKRVQHNEFPSSTILDFRELSDVGFAQSRNKNIDFFSIAFNFFFEICFGHSRTETEWTRGKVRIVIVGTSIE